MVVDNTVQWLQLNLKETGLPVGFEYFTTNPNIPAGSLPLQGGLYSRLAYPDLWEWVQKQTGYLKAESEWQEFATANGGNVPFYSKGDGTTTFRVPALKCWVKGASSINEIGGYLAAGLPNIDTNVYIGQDGTGYPNGSADSITVGSTSSYPRQTKLFRASDYNTIYGSSDTVQPPSIVGLWCVKAYGTVTNVGSMDVSNIATGLTELETRFSTLENSKVDKEGAAWVVESYRNGKEWYRVWSDGWIEQGGSITTALQDTTITVTLLKVMADTNYQIYATKLMSSSPHANVAAGEKTVEKFKVSVGSSYQHGSTCVEWLVIGQGA